MRRSSNHCHYTFFDKLGYCSKCGEWLGISIGEEITENKLLNQNELEWERWVANNVGELIAASSSLQFVPSKEKIAEILSTINTVTQGNIAAFASLLKILKNTAWGWYKHKTFLTLDALLKISYHIEISLLDFLIRDIDFTRLERTRSSTFSNSCCSKRSTPRHFDRQRVQESLLNVLVQSEDSAPTIKEIAENLGYDRRLLSRHFPDLCQKLVVKRRYSKKINHAKTLENCCQEVRQVTLMLYERGEYPTEARISTLISKPGYLRYKQVRNTFQKTKQEIGLEA
jgi:AraC-like DNA-binding protein